MEEKQTDETSPTAMESAVAVATNKSRPPTERPEPVNGAVSVDGAHDITLLSDVVVTATVELGRTHLPIREVLKLRRGAVVELEKLVGQPADLMVNNTPLAKGEVIVINERFGFRITKFVTRPT